MAAGGAGDTARRNPSADTILKVRSYLEDPLSKRAHELVGDHDFSLPMSGQCDGRETAS